MKRKMLVGLKPGYLFIIISPLPKGSGYWIEWQESLTKARNLKSEEIYIATTFRSWTEETKTEPGFSRKRSK